MGELLEANVIERWRREPLSFIDQVLRDPKTGLAFKLFDAERQFLSHAWQTNDDGRLKYPDQIYSGIKKIGKSTLAAMHVITTVMISGRYAEGYVIANDLEQAQGRVFQAIRQIIESSPLLRREAELYASRIVFPQLSSTIQAISGGDAGAAGGQPASVRLTSFGDFPASERGDCMMSLFQSRRSQSLFDWLRRMPVIPVNRNYWRSFMPKAPRCR